MVARGSCGVSAEGEGAEGAAAAAKSITGGAGGLWGGVGHKMWAAWQQAAAAGGFRSLGWQCGGNSAGGGGQPAGNSRHHAAGGRFQAVPGTAAERRRCRRRLPLRIAADVSVGRRHEIRRCCCLPASCPSSCPWPRSPARAVGKAAGDGPQSEHTPVCLRSVGRLLCSDRGALEACRPYRPAGSSDGCHARPSSPRPPKVLAAPWSR